MNISSRHICRIRSLWWGRSGRIIQRGCLYWCVSRKCAPCHEKEKEERFFPGKLFREGMKHRIGVFTWLYEYACFFQTLFSLFYQENHDEYSINFVNTPLSVSWKNTPEIEECYISSVWENWQIVPVCRLCGIQGMPFLVSTLRRDPAYGWGLHIPPWLQW